MTLSWAFCNYIPDIKKKCMIEIPDSKTPKINKPISPDIKKIMRKNKSIDDFMKHHVPWIL